MPVIDVNKMEWEKQADGILRKEMVNRSSGSGGVTMGFVKLDPGAIIEWHKHYVEDVGHVIEGDLTLYIGDEEFQVRDNMTMLIPANAPHRLVNGRKRTAVIVFTFPTAVVERQSLNGPK